MICSGVMSEETDYPSYDSNIFYTIQTYIHVFYMIQTYIHVTVYPFKKSMSDPFGLPKFESNRTNKLLKNEKKNSLS